LPSIFPDAFGAERGFFAGALTDFVAVFLAFVDRVTFVAFTILMPQIPSYIVGHGA
jgi:hypothetical protein